MCVKERTQLSLGTLNQIAALHMHENRFYLGSNLLDKDQHLASIGYEQDVYFDTHSITRLILHHAD